MAGEKLHELVKQGSIIGYIVPDVRVSVAYVELWPNALFWCSTEGGCSGGPHVLKFDRMDEKVNQVSFYQGGTLLATLAPYDEWPEIESILAVYQLEWKRWNAFPKKKQEAERYWSKLGEGMK